MPKALIIGTGMLGSALQHAAGYFGLEANAVAHSDLELANPQAVSERILRLRPDVIFHTAALTRVNYCEQHPQEAQAVNVHGTQAVLAAAEQAMTRVVYFSTDYVFDGRRSSPYRESDTPAPLNVYGASKLAGEQAVQGYHRGYIVRTSGVFGPRGDGIAERNFLRAIISRYRADTQPICVVLDQFTALTYAPHLATMVLSLLDEELPPLCHLTSHGYDSWFGWASRVFAALGLDQGRLQPVTAQDYDSSTPRPGFSVLDSEHAAARALMSLHHALPAAVAYCRDCLESQQQQD